MTRDDLLRAVCKGDRDAFALLDAVMRIAHVWDDLIDCDNPVDPADINAAFMLALVDLPRNPFYVRYFDLLNPLLLSAINNWRVANILEAGGNTDDHRIAFISRSSYIDLVTQVAFIQGGVAAVQELGPVIRRFVHQEGWDAYLLNLDHEIATREKRMAGG